jgi:hypothetical protein
MSSVSIWCRFAIQCLALFRYQLIVERLHYGAIGISAVNDHEAFNFVSVRENRNGVGRLSSNGLDLVGLGADKIYHHSASSRVADQNQFSRLQGKRFDQNISCP